MMWAPNSSTGALRKIAGGSKLKAKDGLEDIISGWDPDMNQSKVCLFFPMVRV